MSSKRAAPGVVPGPSPADDRRSSGPGSKDWLARLTMLPGQSGGNQVVGVLRVAAAIAIAGYAITYARLNATVPTHITLAVLAISVGLVVTGSAQAWRKIGASPRSAALVVITDLIFILGLTRLYLFNAHDDFFVLLFFLVIEAGLILGSRGAVVFWAASVIGYSLASYLGGTLVDLEGDIPALLLWYGSLLIAATVAGVLCDEAAGRERDKDLLRASERQLRLVVDNAPEAVYTVDLDGRVLTWNPAAARMFGWTAEEVIGQVTPDRPGRRVGQLRPSAGGGRGRNAVCVAGDHPPATGRDPRRGVDLDRAGGRRQRLHHRHHRNDQRHQRPQASRSSLRCGSGPRSTCSKPWPSRPTSPTASTPPSRSAWTASAPTPAGWSGMHSSPASTAGPRPHRRSGISTIPTGT